MLNIVCIHIYTIRRIVLIMLDHIANKNNDNDIKGNVKLYICIQYYKW